MKIYGKASKHLKEGQEYQVTQLLADILVKKGVARLEKEEKPKRTRRKKKEDE